MVDDEYMSPKAFDSSGGDLLSLIAFESSFFRMDIMFILGRQAPNSHI
jgi:hypothetical protein